MPYTCIILAPQFCKRVRGNRGRYRHEYQHTDIVYRNTDIALRDSILMFLTYTRHPSLILQLEMPKRGLPHEKNMSVVQMSGSHGGFRVAYSHHESQISHALKNASLKWSFRAELLNLLSKGRKQFVQVFSQGIS